MKDINEEEGPVGGDDLVLIVEDHADSRSVYRTLFQHLGYRVAEAENGAEGIEKAISMSPHVILMDIAMPVLDGIEATRRLRNDPRTRDIPVLVMTAHTRESDKIKALEAGCVDYITKPCSPREIARRVAKVIQNPKSLGANQTSCPIEEESVSGELCKGFDGMYMGTERRRSDRVIG